MDAAELKVEKLIDLLAYRRDRFALLADVFACETPEDTVMQMVAHAAESLHELDESPEAALSARLASLATEDPSVLATLIRTEYARLFLGPRTVLAPMHESAYLSGTPRMFTAETLAVRAFYESFGYRMKAKNREPEDSIAVELEFIRNLCTRCLDLLADEVCCSDVRDEVQRLIAAQRAFENQHLMRWAPAFVQRVEGNDQSGFLAAWARFLADVLAEDEMLLAQCEQALVTREGAEEVQSAQEDLLREPVSEG